MLDGRELTNQSFEVAVLRSPRAPGGGGSPVLAFWVAGGLLVDGLLLRLRDT